MSEEKENVFAYLKPNEEQLEIMEEFRQKFFQLSKEIEDKLPNGRYKALTKTALEETAMWLNKSITRD